MARPTDNYQCRCQAKQRPHSLVLVQQHGNANRRHFECTRVRCSHAVTQFALFALLVSLTNCSRLACACVCLSLFLSLCMCIECTAQNTVRTEHARRVHRTRSVEMNALANNGARTVAANASDTYLDVYLSACRTLTWRLRSVIRSRVRRE